ncbi:di-trans,poly-cis-decaprenylcistransferase [Candidatus Saccharibacteria bacterium]|nr:MAG: di-trans,poly-cis-decaprenylcistransferase [Candidatus Saccharibacteria bacterium]
MDSTPQHIGFIVDGNRRWAKEHGIPTYEGHLAGYNTLKDTVIATIDAGVPFVSIYAFSTENWKRGEGEVGNLMKLAHRVMRNDIGELLNHGIRVKFIGTREGLSEQICKDMDETEERSKDLTNGTVAVCFNYGGQREIVDAARKCFEDGLTAEEITEEAIAKRLYFPELPPVDIVVRTSNEQRISNFMLWRTAYSEFMFLEKFWPDMTKQDVADIIEEYKRRSRRFGK